MNALLEVVVSNAVLASLMAIGVAVATRFVRRPEVAYWLWALVLIKLITPPVLQVPVWRPDPREPVPVEERSLTARVVSSHDAPGGAEAIPAEMVDNLRQRVKLLDELVAEAAEPAEESGQSAFQPAIAATEAAQPAVEPVRSSVLWPEVLVGVWLLGALLWYAVAAVRVVRFGRLLRQAEPAPESLQSAARRVSARFGLRRCPEICVVGARIPPLLWGSVRGAKIVLPSDLMCQLTEAEQRTLLAHDLAHFRRGDHLVRWVEGLILGIFWWHPVVWWARSRMRQAEESCCDAWVLWAFPDDAKRYAHTLLTAVEFLSAVRTSLPVVASGVGHFGSLQRRLEMIVNRGLRRRVSWLGFVSVVLAALLVLPWSAGSLPAEVAEGVAQVDADPDVPVEGPYRVSGTVVSPDGEPLEGAQVFLVGREPFHPLVGPGLPYLALPEDLQSRALGVQSLEETTTDSAGRFVLREVSASVLSEWTADIVVRAKGYGLGLAEWNGAAELKIELPKPVTIEGRLVAPDGSPASGVLVEPRSICRGANLPTGDYPEETLPAFWPGGVRTDGEGRFVLSGLPEESQVGLRLRDPRYGTDRLVVETALETSEPRNGASWHGLARRFTYQLSPPRRVKGVVTAADTGEPVVGAFIEVTAEGTPYSTDNFGRTDEQGGFSINTRDAEAYHVRVYPAQDSGYVAASRSHKGWPDGAQELELDFVLHRGKLVRGQVLDDQTDEPIAGASVRYKPASDNPHKRGGFVFRNSALTDNMGRFAITAIAGQGRLSVETPRRIYQRNAMNRSIEPPMPAGLTPLDLPVEGVAEEVVIRMKQGRSVALRVRGPDGEKLTFVRAMWKGIDASHEDSGYLGSYRAPLAVCGTERDLIVSGLDPEEPTTVYLLEPDRKLGALFEIAPETPAGPIEVRLQPTATVTGTVVKPDGDPDPKARVNLEIRFPDKTERLAWEEPSEHSIAYSRLGQRYGQQEPPYAAGKFTLEGVLPGIPLGLEVARVVDRGWRGLRTIPLEPLKSGETYDAGELVVRDEPTQETAEKLPAKPFQEAVFEGGELKLVDGIPVLFLEGEPEQMGRQYGRLALGAVRGAVGLPRQLLGVLGENGAWSRIVQLAQRFRDNYPPQIRREFDAAIETFEGTEEEVDAVTVANVITNMDFPGSALLVEPARSETRGPVFGYNLHVPSFGVLDRMSLVTVRRPQDGRAYVTVGLAGLLGTLSGMNEDGLTVAELAAYGARDSSPKYDPQGQLGHFTCTRLLEECSTVEEAEKLVRSIHHASQMSLAVCDTRRAVVFEVTPRSVVTRGPENDLLVVTNMFRSPELAVKGEIDRHEALKKAGKRREPFSWSDVSDAIGDVGDDSLQMIVFEPGSLKLHVAIGDPATRANMATLDLEELLGTR